ncbi:MAG TPA: alpha/beta fold hydrolase [Casimicrobiaceae bacterium]|nr:alpha/beta fold hydrolase [Casimicrobiaceae bacterium]
MTLQRRLLRWLAYLAGLAAGVLATIILVFAVQARVRLPELHAWHRVTLEQEFRAGRADAPASFTEYLALEGRLFAEMHRRLLADSGAADTGAFSRYNPKSVVARLALETNYNRSYELAPAGETRGAVLLVHGLSDSPYSVRALADTFVAQGYYVLALRLPGHGTVPAGLVDVSWEDWYGAVVLAARHAAAKAGPGKPFVAGGHSTGAALLTLYSLRALADPRLPRPQRLYLVSPAIGISPSAALTEVVASLAAIPAFEKSRWLDVLPEYDPYKYNSFPVNAAKQIYRLTRELQRALDAETRSGRVAQMPRVIAFQSIVDATITAGEVVRGLLGRLPPSGHELVVFDINRSENLEGWIAPGPLQDLERLRAATKLPFRLTLIANRARDTRAVAAYARAAGERDVVVENLPYQWPAGVFSVGHVSLPFPIDDPVYGLAPTAGQFNLGALAAKGESGALVVRAGTFERLRSNPFWGVIQAKVVATETPAGAAP